MSRRQRFRDCPELNIAPKYCRAHSLSRASMSNGRDASTLVNSKYFVPPRALREGRVALRCGGRPITVGRANSCRFLRIPCRKTRRVAVYTVVAIKQLPEGQHLWCRMPNLWRACGLATWRRLANWPSDTNGASWHLRSPDCTTFTRPRMPFRTRYCAPFADWRR